MKQVKMKTSIRILAILFGLFLSVGAFAQSTITGQVTDASGEPVIGATVRIVGQDGGVITDIDGNFSIKAVFCRFLTSDTRRWRNLLRRT